MWAWKKKSFCQVFIKARVYTDLCWFISLKVTAIPRCCWHTANVKVIFKENRGLQGTSGQADVWQPDVSLQKSEVLQPNWAEQKVRAALTGWTSVPAAASQSVWTVLDSLAHWVGKTSVLLPLWKTFLPRGLWEICLYLLLTSWTPSEVKVWAHWMFFLMPIICTKICF